MYLKKLELSGFKSFAKKTQLDFSSRITAIVGPNGSGKSNIAEAFRFALGEQRMTHMRSKKTEDLIWNGSPSMARARHASVTLSFDNRESLFDVDFDEVSLKRVIHRDASTEYKLNGSVVRLKDIVELLAGAHIGASGHHIISQGETDRILMVSSSERKTIIEDALGLKTYQYKKQESQRKLEKTQQHKKEVESLRREIGPHLKFLKTQVEKIEKTREMRNELSSLYHTYLPAEKQRLEVLQKEIHDQRGPTEKALGVLQEEMNEARKKLSHLEEKDEKSEKLLEYESALSQLRKKRGDLTREVGRLEGRLEARETVEKQQEKSVPIRDVMKLHTDIVSGLDAVESSENLSYVRQGVSRIRQLLKTFVHSVQTDEDSKSEAVYETIATEKASKEEELQKLSVQEGKMFSSYEMLREEIESDRDSSREAERAVFTLSAKEKDLHSKLEYLESRQERCGRQMQELDDEKREGVALIGSALLDKATNGEMQNFGDDEQRLDIKKRMERLKIRLEDAGTGSGDDIMREYEEVQERDIFLEKQLADLDASTEKLRSLIADLEMRLEDLFTEGVRAINTKFQQLFSGMFGGGKASLVLVQERSDDEVALQKQTETEGIDIHVALPRKKIHGLHMLSGGERALTSIALLFAMSQVNPPPFLLLDETDAALDEANSRRYGDMIELLAKESQLILITHNRETMSRAGILYGVTMGRDGVSQLLSVSLEEAAKVAK